MQRNNTKSCRPTTAEKTELSRLNKEGTQQLKEEIWTLTIQGQWLGDTGNQIRIEQKEKRKSRKRRKRIKMRESTSKYFIKTSEKSNVR